jgi:predicted ester cyclase
MMGPDGTEMPATNKPFSQLFGHMGEIGPDGTLVKEIGVQDAATMLNHLGLSKEPARPPVPVPTPPPTIVIATGSETEAANVAAVRASFDAFNAHDIKAAEALLAAGVVFHEIAMPTDSNLRENRQSLIELWKGFPDARVTPDTVWGAGDYVVATATFTGTNTGDFAPMNARKTGRSVSVPALEIDRLADGKIVESWLFYDGMQFARQVMGAPTP